MKKNLSNGQSPPGALSGEVPAHLEMAALEQLGPETRQALRDSPIKILAFHLLADLKNQGARFLNPIVDAAIAAHVRRECVKFCKADRSEHDAELGVRPLVARRTRRM